MKRSIWILGSLLYLILLGLVDHDSVSQPDLSTEWCMPRVLVLPTSNGYDYAQHNYDLDPIIYEMLASSDSLEVLPFPYKTLMRVPYQGVYDKRYCKPIIEKVEADILVMSRFHGDLHSDRKGWGFSVRMLDVNRMKQYESINASGLGSYEAMRIKLRRKGRQLIREAIRIPQ